MTVPRRVDQKPGDIRIVANMGAFGSVICGTCLVCRQRVNISHTTTSRSRAHEDHHRRRFCTGHGVCEGIRPDLFEVGDDGYAHLLSENFTEQDRADLEYAVEQCPHPSC